LNPFSKVEEALASSPKVSEVNEPVAEEHPEATSESFGGKLSIRNLEAWFSTKRALKGINLGIKENSITAFIGPSGCGKTTLIRCLNRMHEMTPGASAKGQVILDGMDM
jgi:phosphate transport system ATP-binding protein